MSSVLNKLSQRDLWDIQVVRSRASEVQPEAQERENWASHLARCRITAMGKS